MSTDRLASDDIRQRRAIQSLSDLTDSLDLTDANSGLAIPRWVKATLGFAAFKTSGLTKQATLYTLPAGSVLMGVKMKHSASFRGSGITSYTVSVGIAADGDKYASAFDVWQSPGAYVYQLTNTLGGESHDAGTVLVASATANANLSNATAGNLDAWLLIGGAA